jgi:predicted MFS family arabinose efflux permease
VVVVAGRNGGVWLGDLVGWHSDFGLISLLLEKFEEQLVLV